MKRSGIILVVIAVLLVVSSSIGSAFAYFTTYARAKGGYTIHLQTKTEITEKVANWTKHVAISIDPKSQPVYVRAKAFSGSRYILSYSDEKGLWSLGEDGFYYYSAPLKGGEMAAELLVHIGNVPEKDVDAFQVVVVYETTPVLYTSEGQPYADWSFKLDTGKTIGGAE